jgi:hypothetical protein
MASYTDIRGLRVKYLSSDPSTATEGEVWYNSTSGTLKASLLVGAWSSGGSSNSNTSSSISGTQTAALAALGYSYSPTSPVGGRTISEEYNGATWTSGGEANTSRYQNNSSGPQTATMVLGGAAGTGDSGPYTISAAAEDYNGTGWTSLTNLPVARAGGIPMVGPADTLLATGGNDNMSGEPIDTTFEYTSSSWTTGTAYPNPQNGMGAVGTQTAAFFYGGTRVNTGNPAQAETNTYNGTSFSAETALPAATRNWGGKSGTQTDCIAACGTPGPGSPNPFENTTLTWDGSAWSTSAATTAIARNGAGGNMSGTSTSALIARTGSPRLATEEYDLAVGTQTLTTS